ncbi:MAG: S1C family serine protease [Gemmatimonadota bacterium]|nr:S1C family serine protease [Gemmatimonadota bacterium]
MTAPRTGDRTGSTLVALSTELADAVERAGRWTVAIHARRRIPSSGIVWRSGVVVAASHTIRRDEDISLTLPDGTSVPVTLAGRDPGTDLAVFRLPDDAPTVTAATLAPDDALRVGALVVAVGRPGDDVTASLGAISALGGEWRTWQGGRVDRFVRLDLAIYDGFSGGPLVDAAGRLLGVNTSGLTRSAPIAIPVSTVTRVADELLAKGHVRRGYAGVAVQPIEIPERLVREHGLPAESALLVVAVEPGGPADAAGILIGDILTALGGAPLREPADLLAGLSTRAPVEVRVVRGGAPVSVSLTPGDRPARGGRAR